MHPHFPVFWHKASVCACGPGPRSGGFISFKLGKHLFNSLWTGAQTSVQMRIFVFYFPLLFYFPPPSTKLVLLCNWGCGRSVLLPSLLSCGDGLVHRNMMEVFTSQGPMVIVEAVRNCSTCGQSASLTPTPPGFCVGEDLRFLLSDCCVRALLVP